MEFFRVTNDIFSKKCTINLYFCPNSYDSLMTSIPQGQGWGSGVQSGRPIILRL